MLERLTGSEMNKLTVANMQVEALRKQVTDAQATIAALQARVKELEDGTTALLNQQSERLAVENEKLTMALSQLTQRTAECDALKLVNDTHMKTVMKLSHVVEQRTAELEAAQREARLQKEVEAALSSKVVEYEVELNGDPQNFYGRGRTVGLRTLIAALPKVEGEIVIWEVGTYHRVHYCTSDGSVVILARFKTREDANKYAALLQHRQGMEG